MKNSMIGKRMIFLLLGLCFVTLFTGCKHDSAGPLPDQPPTSKLQWVNNYYHVDDLNERGLKGKGVRVAIVTFDTFTVSDIQRFSDKFGLPKPKVNVIPLFGGAIHQGVASNGHVESTLDIDIVHAVAPDAELDVYTVPPPVPFSVVLEQILNEGHAQIVTISWGRAPNLAEDKRAYDVIEAMNKQGMTVFASTGDTGTRADNTTLMAPSYLPNVVAVGGTVVTIDQAQTTVTERNWPLSVSGWSSDYQSPNYQAEAASSMKLRAESQQHRMLPDIVGPSIVTEAGSITADRDGIPIYVTDPKTGTGAWIPAIGTSVAAPYMAGIFANIAGGLHNGLGDIHERLYKQMNKPAYNKVDASDKTGSFEGGEAYSMAAGLGSVNAYEMAAAFGLSMK
ncbi:subtilase family protein [Paenibacillus taihuensis]|uniref:Subtilase family protein n=1 Tax=Paenibacillus taihuensis TaxID=1156355 RepID=A0A3D9QTV3_9BACL|nr:S8 family serine peptidase [Paenibacillus taihuensis]REE66715.1 subtilase family protein [Paenibacillus taihuensis]